MPLAEKGCVEILVVDMNKSIKRLNNRTRLATIKWLSVEPYFVTSGKNRFFRLKSTNQNFVELQILQSFIRKAAFGN